MEVDSGDEGSGRMTLNNGSNTTGDTKQSDPPPPELLLDTEQESVDMHRDHVDESLVSVIPPSDKLGSDPVVTRDQCQVPETPSLSESEMLEQVATDVAESAPIIDKPEETEPEGSANLTEQEQTPIDMDTATEGYYCWRYNLSAEFSPQFLIQTEDAEFSGKSSGKKTATYLKGCKWAPDGSCLLSCSDDDNLRIFNFPNCFSAVQNWQDEQQIPEDENWNSSLKVKEGGLVYDYCWYPLMSSMDAVSSCFLTTSSEAPVHLWDAFTGRLRASYQAFNHLDQLVSAYSVAFDSAGEKIFCGFEKSIRIFDLTKPGRECAVRNLKQSISELNQYGIVASIAVNPTLRSFYALGSFDKTIGLYCDDGSVICLLQGHIGGLTHMKFSSDGLKLFTGGRKDSRLICWDMRHLGEAYKTYDRVVSTHQRIYFDVTPDNQYLISGGTDGVVKIWDLLSEETSPVSSFKCNNDCVNGVSINPYIPLLATTSGQRHFLEVADDSDDEEIFVKSESCRNRACDIKLWKLA